MCRKRFEAPLSLSVVVDFFSSSNAYRSDGLLKRPCPVTMVGGTDEMLSRIRFVDSACDSVSSGFDFDFEGNHFPSALVQRCPPYL